MRLQAGPWHPPCCTGGQKRPERQILDGTTKDELLQRDLHASGHTYTNADPTHDPHFLQLLSVLLRDHVLIDCIQAERALEVMPPESEIQDGDLICGGEHYIIVYL